MVTFFGEGTTSIPIPCDFERKGRGDLEAAYTNLVGSGFKKKLVLSFAEDLFLLLSLTLVLGIPLQSSAEEKIVTLRWWKRKICLLSFSLTVRVRTRN